MPRGALRHCSSRHPAALYSTALRGTPRRLFLAGASGHPAALYGRRRFTAAARSRRVTVAALCGRSAMSFYDAFRGFFGFPGRCRPRDPLFGSPWDDDEDDEDEAGAPPGPRPRRDFAFSPGGAFEELLRDVAELLGASGPQRGWGGPGGANRPGLTPVVPAEPPLPGSERPLRDSMLKEPEGPAGPWEPLPALEEPPPPAAGPKEDGDLDSHVSSAGLGTILRPQQPRSYFQSVSVTTVTLPDGAVEERRTVQDSQGHRETTITRRRGDQAFITSTKEDGQSKDYREEVLNMDDRELAQFAGTWPDELLSPPRSDPSSLLGTFFRRWFSSW
ncbi:HCLS1-associated protein X-1 [Excalfactoria chinensis]|uniref:HCLS1-associated protein X-1 n=1 Tax=Excalfactoria chinensis TaxID=46218 RepID=UPI003B3B7503